MVVPFFAGDYNSVALGVGRDMFAFGAVSTDITQSYARLPDRKAPCKVSHMSQ